MAKWLNALMLDGGSNHIRTQAALSAGRVKMHVIKAYAAGDSYATVVGNSCGSVDMAAGDYVQSSSSSNRVTTVGAKAVTLTANSGASPNLHVAHVDSVSSEVLFVTDETTDQVLTSGGTFNVPSHTCTYGQPT